MRIGIDFDNTIVNTSVTSKRYLDKHLPGNNLNSYHDLSKNEGLDFFYKYYKDITNSLDLFDGVYEAFSFFKENNIEIALLTARGGGCPEIIDLTKEYLEKHKLYFDKYIFKAFPKCKEAVEYGIDLVIDDTLEVIEDVRNHNVEALQYGVDVKNWYEVINFVRRKLDGQNIRCK